MKKRAPAPVNQIVISPVYVNEPGLLSREQKFPGGFVCNLPGEKQALMQRAADELGVSIRFTEPRQRDPGAFVGVVTDLALCDPQVLLDRYYALNIANSQKLADVGIVPIRRTRSARRPAKRARGSHVLT